MREMTSHRWMLPTLFGAALALVAQKAHAWGDDGHRAVGELAYRYLSPEAQSAVSAALTEDGYRTLADAATWPDTFARRFPEYDAMKPFHYVNVDARAPSYSATRDCPSGCVVSVLGQHLELLSSDDPPLTLAGRRFSIYWIAHLMGDLHQPLHVAHPDARGGTRTLLRFFDAPDLRSAHWIWDFGLFERRPPPAAADSERIATDQPVYRALADELALGLLAAKRREYQRTLSPEAITNEVLALSKRYAYLQSQDHVDAAYEQARWPIVKQQLQRAGARLAAVLERALVKKR